MYKLLKKSENGFSLLELVVAVAVAGIIAAVAVPTFIGLQGDATTEAASYETSISGNHSDVTNEAGYWTGNGGSEGGAAAITITSADIYSPYEIAWVSVEVQSDYSRVYIQGINQSLTQQIVDNINSGAITSVTIDGTTLNIISRTDFIEIPNLIVGYDSMYDEYTLVFSAELAATNIFTNLYNSVVTFQ